MGYINHYIDTCKLSALMAVMLAAPVVFASPIPQDGASQMVVARERVAPAIATHRAFSVTLFAAPSMQYQAALNTAAHFNRMYAGASEPLQNINSLLAMENVRSAFFTESRFPILQLYDGRLHLDAFQNTLHLQSVQSGPSALRSIHFSGLSLGFHLGHNEGTAHPTHAWRRLSQIVGTALD
jgi:protein involved in temperature-dependent protein secretion